MWSFEKIHRCIAHKFLGELVATFDEEFRILFAQSQPLVVENALVPMAADSSSSFLSHTFGLKRTQSLRIPRGFNRHSERSAYSFGERIESALPFRRDDPFRHTIEPGGAALQLSKIASHQVRMQQSFLDQGRSTITSRQLEMNAYKRHSYAEGTRESYSSSRQYMKHRVMNNLEEMEAHYQRDQHFYQSEGPGLETGHRLYDRSYGLHRLDQYSDPMYPPELEAPESENVLSSEDVGYDPENKHHQAVAHYGPPSQKRPTIGQSYACQSSPTQLHPPDHKQMFPSGDQGRQLQDPSVKQGLRSWRINSYLSAYEDAGEEGLQQPIGTDAFEEPQQQPENRQYLPEGLGHRFNTQESSNIQNKLKLDFQPRFSKPILPERNKDKSVSTKTDSQIKSALSAAALTTTGTESEKETDTKEISITKHESFRTRINPMLQRSSRLRSSLIFSSSKLEQHSSTLVTPGGKLQEEEENSSIRTSSIVAEILEKRRSLSREPFDFSKQKKTDEKDSKALVPGEVTFKPEEPAKEKNDDPIKDIRMESKDPKQYSTVQKEPSTAKLITPILNINDPASRLQYFKELAAKRKDSKTTPESVTRTQEPPPKKPDLSVSPPHAEDTVPTVSITIADSTTSVVPANPAAKPPVVPPQSKPFELSKDKIHRGSSELKEESTEALKKETKEPKLLKPFPSPKFFKKDTLKPFKGSHSRRTSCGEDILTDATDAEKSEFKKSRSLSSSSMSRSESKEPLSVNKHGSNTSLNLIGSEGKDTKALDFLKKQTQRLKGILGPKGEKKNSGGSSNVEDKQMKTVPEVMEESSPKGKETPPEFTPSTAENPKPISKPSQSRYQSSTSTVLFSSNLRDDTKVILEQISANSQKNRQELTKQAEESGEGENGKHVSDRDSSQRYQNRFGRPQANPQERDSLLKRIESMRKEKKVYSRFEVLYCSREEGCWDQGN